MPPSHCRLCTSCEQTLANAPGEAHALTEAARNFVDAEQLNVELRCPSFEEHLSAAINCYSHAIRVGWNHIKQNCLFIEMHMSVFNLESCFPTFTVAKFEKQIV